MKAMDLRLYNTKTRRKEAFAPLDPRNVRLYVCGPTVYDRAHVGNARPVLVFDVLARLLRRIYGQGHVTYVRNITDVDDKIINAARENGESIDALTARTTAAFHADMAALGALPPDVEPRATGTIPEMIALIAQLIARGHAYEAQGHVLFNVPSFAGYGALSRRPLDEMIAGARVEVAPYKKHPADFVLWKPSTPDQPGWESPWGRGRPGWHIECSAMSEKHLGQDFDIHGGGLDLIFPHHENEIAQSVCARDGAGFARVWMHNGFVTVDGEKMSKSLGNFRTVREVLDAGHKGETIRTFMLQTHYRQPLDWTEAGLQQAKNALDYLYRAAKDAAEAGIAPAGGGDVPESVLTALHDDLNTPLALAGVGEAAARVHAALKAGHAAQAGAELAHLRAAADLLGVLQGDSQAWFHGGADAEVESLIAARNAARKAKDFAEADRIRQALAAKGIVLEDKPGGRTEWRRAG